MDISINKLIAMGCSWTEGCGDDYSKQGWPARLVQKINRNSENLCELNNLGHLGDSNWIQYAQLLNYLDQTNCLVIWGLTAFSRDIFYINNKWKTSYAHEKKWKNYYIEYDDCAAQLKHLYLMHSFQQLVEQKNSKHFIFLSFDDISRLNRTYNLGKFNHVYDLIDWSLVLTEYSMCDYIGNNLGPKISEDAQEYFMALTKKIGHMPIKKHKNFASDGHPNSNGYDLWADHLYDTILPKIFN